MNKAKIYSLKVETSDFDWKKITSSNDAQQYCRQFFKDDIEIYESFFMIMLTSSNVVKGWAKISQGGLNATVVDPMIVAKYAIDSLAKCVIVCHNHPSGVLTPSSSDLAITKKIKDGLKLFDITLHDHIILTSQSYHSMSDSGQM